MTLAPKLLKTQLLRMISSTELGKTGLRAVKWMLGRDPRVDYQFPNLINIEVASTCNLKCIHCPSHSPDGNPEERRKYGVMRYEVFDALMQEVDAHGPRSISLHKDGEPLLNREIVAILDRVKRHHNHNVYLTTNGLLLTETICEALVRNRIDQINFSIGANSEEMYKKIRGGDLRIVKRNIDRLLETLQASSSQCLVSVQIIELEDVDMRQEIEDFKNYWKNKPVRIDVWPELTWGTKNLRHEKSVKRYPCFSLWNSFTINSDGKVSACCMDWNQSLVVGETGSQSIASIWQGATLQQFRSRHLKNELETMPLCVQCNYWQWQPQKMHYKT